MLLLPFVSYFVVSLVPAFVEPRLALPLLPIFAVWGGLLASRLLRAEGALRYAGAALLALAFVHEYGAALHLDLRMLSDSRYEAEAWIAAHVPKSEPIAALSAPGFLPRVEHMGYDVHWYAIADIRHGALEADGAEWAMLDLRRPSLRGSQLPRRICARAGWATRWRTSPRGASTCCAGSTRSGRRAR